MVFVADMVSSFWLVLLWDPFLGLFRRQRRGAASRDWCGGAYGLDEPGTALDRVKCRCYCEGAGLSGVEARVVSGRNALFVVVERAVSDR